MSSCEIDGACVMLRLAASPRTRRAMPRMRAGGVRPLVSWCAIDCVFMRSKASISRSCSSIVVSMPLVERNGQSKRAL
eukprot:5921302-Prymnesium_polylepis.1